MSEKKVKQVPVISLVVGADLGNSSTEIALQNEKGEFEYYTQPTVIQYNSTRPPVKTIDSVKTEVASLLDHLTIYYANDKIGVNGHYSVGNIALKEYNSVRNMDIVRPDKSNNEIPIISSISMIAAISLQKYFAESKEMPIPDELEAQIHMCSAIPASEYTVESAETLEKRFKEKKHTVKFYVGEKTIEVTVNVLGCAVTEEGKTAMLAIEEIGDAALKHYRETYETPSNKTYYDAESKLTVEELLESETFHTDIGDGTTENTYIIGINPQKSEGIVAGVGHVTAQAISLYKARLKNTVGEVKRQFFMDLMKKTTPKGKLAKETFEQALQAESKDMLEKMKGYYISLTNSTAEYLIVHGGGATVYKENIYDDYVKFAHDALAKVIWIPQVYATKMNSTGLLVLALNIFGEEE